MESLSDTETGKQDVGLASRTEVVQCPLHGGTETGGHHPEAAQPGGEHLPSVPGVPACAHRLLGRPSLEEPLPTGSGVCAHRPQRAVQRSRSEGAVWPEGPRQASCSSQISLCHSHPGCCLKASPWTFPGSPGILLTQGRVPTLLGGLL